jgi:hypothetical protein
MSLYGKLLSYLPITKMTYGEIAGVKAVCQEAERAAHDAYDIVQDSRRIDLKLEGGHARRSE